MKESKTMMAFKLIAVLTLFWAMGVSAWAATLTASWDPPTHTVNASDCNINDRELVAADLDRIVYIISYREVGTQEWLSIETTATTIVIPNLKFSTSYEAHVGAKWPNGTVQCVTANVTATTGAEPNPGRCGRFQFQ